MMKHKDPTGAEKTGLTAKQQLAAFSLARGLSIAKTAKEIGIADVTIDRWKRLPHFMAAILEAEDTLYHEQLRQLKKTVGAAIACLVRNMQEGKPYVQVAAASKLLDLSIQVHKVEDLEREVEELRQLVGQGDNLT